MRTVDSQKRTKALLIIKTIVLVLFISAFASYYFLAQPYHGSQCIQDIPMQWLLPLNRMIAQNKTLQNIVIGIGQVCIDGWVIFISIFWIWKIKSFRAPVSFGLAFGLRTLLLNIIKFQFTPHWVWDSPGFPSLAVPYDKTRDFFYSGHTTVLIVIFFQLRKLNCFKLSLLNLLCLTYTVIMLLTCQVHYTIDVVGAVIFSNYWYQIVTYFLIYIDMLFGFPVLLWIKCKRKKQQKDSLDSNLQIDKYERMESGQMTEFNTKN